MEMACRTATKRFRLVAMKGSGSYSNFGTVVPDAARQFMARADEIPQHSGVEIALFEPKIDEGHLTGSFYVGLIVNEAVADPPAGMEYMEFSQPYASIRGPLSRLDSLHHQLLQWLGDQGMERDLNRCIVETYHPKAQGEEEVEIHLPILA